MKFSKAFLIFLATTILIWLVNWYLVIIPIPKANEFFGNLPNYANKYVADTYPEDLVIDIKGGKVSVNRPSPYCLTLEKTSSYGVVFDNKAEPLANLFDSTGPYSKLCKPLAVVGSNFFVYQEKGEGSYKVQTISAQVTYKLTKDEINKFISLWLPKILRYGKLLYWSIPFVIIIFMVPWSLAKNLFYALVVIGAFRIFKIKAGITYKEAYTKSLLGLAIVSVLTSLLTIGLNIPLIFPFLGTVLITIVTLLLEKYYFSKLVTAEAAKDKPTKNPSR